MESPLDSGRLYFDIGDNIDAVYGSGSGDGPDIAARSAVQSGFLFSSFNTAGIFATASLLFIALSGKTYGRGFEARDYSQSLVNQVGFHGTASCAVTAAYALAGVGGGSTPVGAIMDYAGANAPTGWAICSGSELAQASYPALYAVLGTTWGVASNPGTLFKLPDLRKRFTLGAGPADVYLGSVGQTGGSENLNSHYHLIAQTANGIYGNGGTANDDLLFIWVNNQTVNMTSDFPTYVSPQGGNHGFYWDFGPLTSNLAQPVGDFGNGNSSGFILGTSFGFVVGEGGSQDINPPYAVVNKIIRIDP